MRPAPARHRSVATEKDIPAHADGDRFHGPTSALFDSALPGDGETHAAGQLERIHLRTGKLNFHGIDPDLGMELLAVFWNRQHATGSVVYRPSFMRDMAATANQHAPYFSELLLNVMLFVAYKHLPRANGTDSETSCQTASSFRCRVEILLYRPEDPVLCKSSIPTIQALLLLADALFTWCDERSLAWHYLGIAINMIIDLGLHSADTALFSATSLSAEVMEIRQRVFWAAFVLDKLQSIYQGRPPRLRDADISVPLTFWDEYDELEPFDTIGYSATPECLSCPTYSVSTFEHLCRLIIIADHVLDALYAEKRRSKTRDAQDFQTAQKLHTDLLQWRASLPKHLAIHINAEGNPRMDEHILPLPHTLCLNLMYHSIIILLYRPFVSESHLGSEGEIESESEFSSFTASNAFSLCEHSAVDIDALLRWYQARWCIKTPPYFLSYAVYVSATIHVRTAAREACQARHLTLPVSTTYRRYSALECLQNCLGILEQHQNVCRAPRTTLRLLRGLIQRLHVNVDLSEDSGCNIHSIDNLQRQGDDAIGAVLSRTTEVDAGMGSLAPDNSLDMWDGETPTDSAGNTFEEWLANMSFGLDPLFGFDSGGLSGEQ